MPGFENLRRELENANKGQPQFQKQQQQPQKQDKREPEPDVDMEIVLKRVSLAFGIALLVISMYFSYDGFDSSVSGGNPEYTLWAKIIGWIFAMSVSLLQFIFNSSYVKLNSTLKFFGILSYAYSSYTDYLGIVHTLHMVQWTAIVATAFMDGVPEPLIAWALGASQKGDLIGNLAKVVRSFFIPEKGVKTYHSEIREEYRNKLGH